jgi:hypothetical protein
MVCDREETRDSRSLQDIIRASCYRNRMLCNYVVPGASS